MVTLGCVVTGVLIGLGGAPSQDDLRAVVAAAGRSWMAHDVSALIGSGEALHLTMPGADPSLPVGRSQAVALLRRYVAGSSERGWEVRAVRTVQPGRAYVEAVRRYVVTGTNDERRETVVLSYRETNGTWTLVELRIVR